MLRNKLSNEYCTQGGGSVCGCVECVCGCGGVWLVCVWVCHTFLSARWACGTTMMGSSSSVVRTVSRLPSVKMVERFLRTVLVEKKPLFIVSSAPIKSSFSAVSSNWAKESQDTTTCTCSMGANLIPTPQKCFIQLVNNNKSNQFRPISYTQAPPLTTSRPLTIPSNNLPPPHSLVPGVS